MTLNNSELYSISGGGYGWLLALGAIGTFLIGLVDGLIRPLRCN